MTVINYLWSEDNYLEEYDESGDPIISYTSEPSAFGSLISQNKGAVTNYFQFDVLGSTRQLTDSNENITDTYLFDAWGNEIAQTGTSEVYFRYIGKACYYYDTEVKSYYVRRRSYTPITGRWSSVDPMKYSGTSYGVVSSYKYASNSPVIKIDPSGLIDKPASGFVSRRLAGPCVEPNVDRSINHKSNFKRGKGHLPLTHDEYLILKQGEDELLGDKPRDQKQWFIGFIQQVTIEITFTGGASKTLKQHCCNKGQASKCICVDCGFKYKIVFLETIQYGKKDKHPQQIQTTPVNFLQQACPLCRYLNSCCKWEYAMKVKKIETPALIRRNTNIILDETYDVTACPGEKKNVTPKDPLSDSLPGGKFKSDKSEVYQLYENDKFRTKSFSYGITQKHPKCGPLTETVTGLPEKRSLDVPYEDTDERPF